VDDKSDAASPQADGSGALNAKLRKGLPIYCSFSQIEFTMERIHNRSLLTEDSKRKKYLQFASNDPQRPHENLIERAFRTEWK
jgi:hypothetical protein